MSEVKKRLRISRGTKAQMPTLLTGELGLAEDEEQLYIGTIEGNIPVDKITKGVVQEVSTRVGLLADLTTRIKTGIVAALNGVQEDHDAHNADRTNPHGTTKSHVGLGSVDNVKQATKTEFDTHKVETMPHQMVSKKSTKKYKYGCQISTDGKPQLIYEEVI